MKSGSYTNVEGNLVEIGRLKVGGNLTEGKVVPFVYKETCTAAQIAAGTQTIIPAADIPTGYRAVILNAVVNFSGTAVSNAGVTYFAIHGLGDSTNLVGYIAKADAANQIYPLGHAKFITDVTLFDIPTDDGIGMSWTDNAYAVVAAGSTGGPDVIVYVEGYFVKE